ncbi:Protein trichome berefringence-like 7 [Trifolium repens]|nr:Protein trichome berefringence-like 7 [Trifolium repens]
MNLCETWLVMHLMHLMGLFSFWISFTKFTTLFTRVFGFVHKIMKGNCNAWILVSFNVLVTTGSLISFILLLSRVYSYAFSTPNSMIKSYEINGETNSSQLQPGPVPKFAPKRVKTTLRLDKIDDISHEWIDSDVLIFNSGHWWTRTKLFDMGWYFQVGSSLKLGLPINSAFKTTLLTWASWVEKKINTNRTRVFFRTYESSHWSGNNHNACKVTKRPWKRTNGKDRSPVSDMIKRVVKNMSVPVTILNVTPMDAYRSDGHVGTWSDNPSVPDCSHWCLPGVPDMWNEILFSYLLQKDVAS